jgi:hypothetical protein
MAVMQKANTDGGELRVRILDGGKVEKEESSTADYGVVQVNYSPKEERPAQQKVAVVEVKPFE